MLLGEKEKQVVQQRLQGMTSTVKLVMFTQELECDYCRDTRDLVQQVAELSDQVEAEIYNFVTDRDKAEEYGIDKIPAIAIVGEKDYGVRYYGIPAGYEFGALIEDIASVSKGDSELMEESRAFLAKLNQDVHLQVFTTPT